MIDIEISQSAHLWEDSAEEFDSRVSEVIGESVEEVSSFEEPEIQVLEIWEGGECFDESCDTDCSDRTACETKSDDVRIPLQ